jgi:hypothetical protein
VPPLRQPVSSRDEAKEKIKEANEATKISSFYVTHLAKCNLDFPG